jgi:hypothetical protein
MEQPFIERPNFYALQNALYHTDRRSALDFRNRILSLLTIVLGTGVVSKIGDQHGITTWLELGTVIAAASQLVFDFGGQARTHDFLQRRYFEFLSEVDGKNLENHEEKQKINAKLLLICSEEPITMRALNAVAYNQAIDATVYDTTERKSQRLKVTWLQRLLRNWCVFQNVDFPLENPPPCLAETTSNLNLWNHFD